MDILVCLKIWRSILKNQRSILGSHSRLVCFSTSLSRIRIRWLLACVHVCVSVFIVLTVCLCIRRASQVLRLYVGIWPLSFILQSCFGIWPLAFLNLLLLALLFGARARAPLAHGWLRVRHYIWVLHPDVVQLALVAVHGFAGSSHLGWALLAFLVC